MHNSITRIFIPIIAFILTCPAYVSAQVISIQGANMVVTSNTYLSTNNITTDLSSSVANQGTISLNALSNSGSFTGVGTYNVAGNISNTGSFIATTATVNFNGASAQNINAAFTNNQLYNLIISNTNTGGVNLSNTLEILNSVSFGNVNNAVLNTGGFLTIKSFPANTALIADITNNNVNSGNTINGNVIVERYIPANNLRGYRYIAPSVNTSSSIHANWQEGATSRYNNPNPGYGTHITGSHIDQAYGFDGTITSQPSLYRYDVATNNYIAFSNTNVNTLNAKTAYLLFFRGDRTINLDVLIEGSSNTTLRATGTLAQGTQTFSPLVGNTDPNGGFNLIANPYAAPVNWSKIYANNSGISKYYTYFDNRINGGSFVTVDNTGIKSNITSAATIDIQSGEAFWIQSSTAAQPSLTITENSKSSSNNINVFKPIAASQTLYTSLFVTDNIGRRNADGVLTSIDDSFNGAIDQDDADELENFNENIALNSLGHHLAIESKPSSKIIDTIHLYMSNMNQKDYDLQFDSKNLSTSYLSAFLVDNFTGIRLPIDLNSQTIIPFTVTSNPASKDTGRFYILLHPTSALPVTIIKFSAIKNINGVQLYWTSTQDPSCIYQIFRSGGNNEFVRIGEVASDIITKYSFFDKDPLSGNNSYRIKILYKDGTYKYSETVNVTINNQNPKLTVFPNPVVENKLKFTLNNCQSGNYMVSLINAAGKVVYSQTVKCTGPFAHYEFSLKNTLPKGFYSLRVGEYNTSILLQ